MEATMEQPTSHDAEASFVTLADFGADLAVSARDAILAALQEPMHCVCGGVVLDPATLDALHAERARLLEHRWPQPAASPQHDDGGQALDQILRDRARILAAVEDHRASATRYERQLKMPPFSSYTHRRGARWQPNQMCAQQ